MIINEEFYYHPPQMPPANQKHPSAFIIHRPTSCRHLSCPLPAESPLAWLLQAITLSHSWFSSPISYSQLSNSRFRSWSALPLDLFSPYIVVLFHKHASFSKPLKHSLDSSPIFLSLRCYCYFSKCTPVTPWLLSSLGFVLTRSLGLVFLWGSFNSPDSPKSRLTFAGSTSAQYVLDIHIIPCHDVFYAQSCLKISCP